MTSSSVTLVKGTWTSVAANVAYLMQNISGKKVVVKAQGSATVPTSSDGAFVLQPTQKIGSGELSGYIYAMCKEDSVTVVVAK